MNFFFGGSRSWVAREARRKARHMAQKKRKAILKTTISAFSFVVLSISLWSLMRMRHVGYTTGPDSKNTIHRRGNLTTFAVKTAGTPQIEMPRPPLEPPAPTMTKMENSSAAVDGNVGSVQGRDVGPTSAHVQNHSNGGAVEKGQGTEKSPSSMESVHRSSRDAETHGSSSYKSRSDDRASSASTAVRGMNQDDSGAADSAHGEVTRESGSQTTRDSLQDSGETGNDEQGVEVQKQEAMDTIDADEGGEAPVITLAKRRYSARREGEPRGKAEAVGRGIVTQRARESHVADRSRHYENETDGKTYAGGMGTVREASTGRMPSRSDVNRGDARGEHAATGSGFVQEAGSENRVAAGRRYFSGGVHMKGDTLGSGVSREAAIENRMVSGSEHFGHEMRGRFDKRNGAARDENRVAGRSIEMRDPAYDSRGTSSIEGRRRASYVRAGRAAEVAGAGSGAAGPGITGSGVTVRNDGRTGDRMYA